MQIHLQVYALDRNLVSALKITLLLLAVLSLLVAFVNVRRIKTLFSPLAFLYLVALLIATLVNGQLIRQVHDQQRLVATKAGCRDTMQTLGELTLNQIGCPTKYLSYKESPFLPCTKDQQTYMWEQDQGKVPEARKNTLACLNMECCPVLSKKVLSYAENLSVTMSLIVSLGFVMVANTLALSKTLVKIFRIRVLGDFAVMVVLSLLISLLIGVIYYYVPVEPQQVQFAFVE